MPSADNGEVGLRTLASTAKFLAVGRTTVYHLCVRGELETVNVGRRGHRGTRITQASIDRYIMKLSRKPRPLRETE